MGEMAPAIGLPEKVRAELCAAAVKLAKDAAVDTFERGYLGALLESCGGNMSKAARTAGMDRMYLHRLAQKHGLRAAAG